MTEQNTGGGDGRARSSEEENRRRKVRGQIRRIIRAHDNRVTWVGDEGSDDEADFHHLQATDRFLVRGSDVEEVRRVIVRDAAFGGPARIERRSDFPQVARLTLAPGRAEGVRDILAALRTIRDRAAAVVVAPEYYLHITTNATCCPASEPEETGLLTPWPQRTESTTASGVKVSVVDTGWHPTAATNDPTKGWLSLVTGDDEENEQQLREYAGHGTFVAGVVRCRAPQAKVRVDGFLTHGGAAGAISEYDMVRQLIEALTTFGPHVINVSAGTTVDVADEEHGLLSFQQFHEQHLAHRKDVVLVAAAGNYGSPEPFYPAAYDWALGVGSLDRDGTVSDFSNWGPNADVFALGRNHVNAFPKGRYVCHEEPNAGDERVFSSGLARWSGTSFASPLVAGLIAARIKPGQVGAKQATQQVLDQAVKRCDPVRGDYCAVPNP